MQRANVTDMAVMFCQCYSLKNIDLSNFDTSKVTNMYQMFYDCRSLTNLDLTGLDTSKVTDMTRMFYKCGKLNNILVGPNWKVPEDNPVDMFEGCGVKEVTMQK